MDKVHVFADKARRDLNKIQILHTAQDATGVDKLYIVGAAGALSLSFLLIGFGAGFICNVIGFAYPAYCSFLAIESDTKHDDVQWLTYWVIYACFNVLEVFVDLLLAWIPFYYAFKLGFLLWLFMPSTQGASFLYHHFLSPLLTKSEGDIDRSIKDAFKKGGAMISDISGAAKEAGRDAAKTVADSAHDIKAGHSN